LLFWSLFSNSIIEALFLNSLSPDLIAEFDGNIDLFMSQVANLVGQAPRFDTSTNLLAAANDYARLSIRVDNIAYLGLNLLALCCLVYGLRKVGKGFEARNRFERILLYLLILCSFVAILITLGIAASLLFESLLFFADVSPINFFFGETWSPESSLEGLDSAESSFGLVPLLAGTLLVGVVAMAVAIPLGLSISIYLSQYAGVSTRSIIRPVLEILAGIPTVVYGFIAALAVGPAFANFGDLIGLPISAQSALTAGFVIGIMVLPYITSMSDDALQGVPATTSEAALALGATRAETVFQILLPAAMPGIAAAIILAASRAIGETMIVVMVAGLVPIISADITQPVTTITAQIVALLTGETDFESTKTLSAFALGLTLFAVTLILNLIALSTVKKSEAHHA